MGVRFLRRLGPACFLAAAGVFLAGGIAEVFLRVATNNLGLSPGIVRSNVTRRYELVPGFQGWTYDKRVRINAFGLRGAEISEAKSDGVVRILCVGDSVTFGQGVNVEDSYPKLLEELIGASDPARRVEVLNFGVPSYNTASEVTFLKERGVPLRPDIVILQFTVDNDAETTYGGVSVRTRPVNWVKDQFRRLYLYSFLAAKYYTVTQRIANLDTPAATNRVERIRRNFAESNPGWRDVGQALDEFTRLAVSAGFRPVVVVFPILEKLEDYPYGFAHQKLLATIGARAEVVDLLRSFRGHRADELWLRPNDGHPNRRGHELIAGAIFDLLLREGMLRSGR